MKRKYEEGNDKKTEEEREEEGREAKYVWHSRTESGYRLQLCSLLTVRMCVHSVI